MINVVTFPEIYNDNKSVMFEGVPGIDDALDDL